MILNSWLSGVPRLLQFRSRARLRQRRQPHFSRVAAEVSSLEARALLSSSYVGPESLVNPTVAGTQSFGAGRSFAMNASQGAIVAWSSPDGGGSSVFAQQYAVDGTATGSAFKVNTSNGGQRTNAVVGAFGNDKFVVVWQATGPNAQGTDVFARVFNGNGTPLGNEFRINSTQLGDQEEPAVAWISSSQFVVAWDGPTSPGGQSTVFARIFNDGGSPGGNEIRVPTTTAGNKRDCEVVSLSNGGFQIAWSGNGTGDQNGVFFRQFNGSGQPQGSEVRVNTATNATERRPTMARNGNEQIVIAWQATGDPLDTDGSGIIARRFKLDGTAIGGEFLINQTTTGNQDDPSIATMSDGSFVVAWRDSRTPPTTSIYQREFLADGTPRFAERIVNTTLDGAHAHPTIRPQVNGYIIGWDGKIWDGKYNANDQKTFDNQGVGLQRFGDPLMPSATRNAVSDVLFYNLSDQQFPTDGKVPLKTITITNVTNQTIYPIMRAANSARDEKSNDPSTGKPWSLYDPLDPLNEEYRGYIGYQDPKTGKIFVGLLPGQTVTVQVPLVFWDASRVYLATDGTDMFPLVDNLPALSSPPNSPNPFHYHDKMQDDLSTTTARFIEKTVDQSAYVMWYHARSLKDNTVGKGLAEDVSHDSATQLTEFTIRSSYLGTLPTAADIATSEKHDLVNYDVSYVDSMVLPVAMAALDVPIFGKDGGTRLPYGWIGSQLSVQQMQDAIKAFTSDGSANGLGDYFPGKKGWPQFFIPDAPVAGAKVPSGQNVIDLSPNLDKRSSFNQNLFMLTSSPGPIEAAITSHPNGTTELRLDNNDLGPHPEKLTVLQYAIANHQVMDVSSSTANMIQPGTTLLRLENRGGTWWAILDKATGTAPSSGDTVRFLRRAVDYAETRLTDLWYSWADYYVDHEKQMTTQSFEGSLTAQSNVLTFDTEQDASKLVAGMRVKGLGIPDNSNEKTVILKVILKNGDPTKAVGVQLSKLASANEPTTTPFDFFAPEDIARSSEVKRNPFTLTFTGSDVDKALAFSKAVYLVMQAFSTVPVDPGSTLSQQLMANVIGCNIGKVPDIGNVSKTDKFGNAAIPNAIRDATKSVMRGVPDFQDPQYPEATTWYPVPSTPTGNQLFNVWNMNPFVWFVHKKLGMSGYGFSVDDDVADVGADYATKLEIAVGGISSLPQHDEWNWGAPYGTVSTTGDLVQIVNSGPTQPYFAQYGGMYLIMNLDPTIVARINAFDPVSGLGARVTGNGIVNPGTQLTTVKLKLSSTIVLLDKPATAGTGTYTFSAAKLPS